MTQPVIHERFNAAQGALINLYKVLDEQNYKEVKKSVGFLIQRLDKLHHDYADQELNGPKENQ